MIKTFLDWAKENNKSLPLLEKTRSAGISDNYPDAYGGRKYAYPDGYFVPSSANAIGKLTGKMGS